MNGRPMPQFSFKMPRPASPIIRLVFAQPRHGWVHTRLHLGHRILEFVASDVPNNPIEELHAAVTATAAGGRGEVWWHLEPAGYFFELSNVSGRRRLRVLFSEHSLFLPRVEVASVCRTRTELLLPLLRALRQFESFHAREPHWRPTRMAAMTRLRSALKMQAKGCHSHPGCFRLDPLEAYKLVRGKREGRRRSE